MGARLIDELEIRLVHQRGRDEGRLRIVRATMPPGNLAKLVVQRGDEGIDRFATAGSKLVEAIRGVHDRTHDPSR